MSTRATWICFRWASHWCCPLLGLLTASSASARTWDVMVDGTGDVPTIQAAIDSAATGDEVVLYPGTYTPDTWGSGRGRITMKAGVQFRSKFGPVSVVIDGERDRGIMRGDDVGEVRIEGFTITGGLDGLAPGMYFAGDSNPTIANCFFVENHGQFTSQGSAIFSGPATIVDCEFISNRREMGQGSAVWCENALIENCVFRGNRVGLDGVASGGAVFCRNTTIRNCVFEGNVSSDNTGSSGGAISGSDIRIESSHFINNRASCAHGSCVGGAVFVRGSGGVITDCVFVGNRSQYGGAVFGTKGSTVTIERCTFMANRTDLPGRVGGIHLDGGGQVRSAIIVQTVNGPACGGMGNPVWSCSNLYDNPGGNGICGIDGGGNFSANPEFCATDPAVTRDFGIQQDSPCAPGNHPEGQDCGRIGAGVVACGTTSVRESTWSKMKALYR